MLTKRLITSIFILTGCLGAYFLLHSNFDARIEMVLTHAKKNDFVSAEETLNKLKVSKSSPPLATYRGFIAQMRGRFEQSDSYFQIAYKEALPLHNEELLLKITLAQAMNAYRRNLDNDFFSYLKSAQGRVHNPSLLPFLEGVVDYLEGHYQKVIRSWTNFSLGDLHGDEWLSTAFEKLFPNSWQQLHLAHCFIEMGEIAKGREILEKESRYLQSQNSECKPLAMLFLGFSYLKEANQIPFEQRGSYYKLSRFYFEQAQCGDLFHREKEKIIAHVEKEAAFLLAIDLSEEQDKWVFDYIHTLEDWKATESLERLTTQLARKILLQKNPTEYSICYALRKEFFGAAFHSSLEKQILSEIGNLFMEEDSENLFNLWANIEPLGSSAALTAKSIASVVIDKIFQVIVHDSSNLESICHFIDFWETLNPTSSERERLAHELLFHSKLIWQKTGEEKNAGQLMCIAFTLAKDNDSIHKEIDSFLTELYVQAENTNMVHRLTCIYDAMKHFHICKNDQISPSKIANHLADAEYLFQSQNYANAKLHATWILKLAPTNERALRLYGLSSFHLGEYGKAVVALQNLSHLDEQVSHALTLSQVYANQTQDEHLAKMDGSDSFDGD